MNELEKQIEKYQDTVKEFTEAREDLLNVKADFTLAALGVLMQKLFSGVDELLEGVSKKEYFDNDLGKTIKESIESVITEFAKQKSPTIEFKPQVKVDMQPIANEISKQNDTMIKLLNKLSIGDNGKSEELQRLILVMTQKQISFLETGMKQFDYTDQLKSIAQKPEYAGKITKRDDAGRIDTWTMKPINSNK